MTTPRDDIAGLIERLREDVCQLTKMTELVKDPSLLRADLDEAAAQLDAQAAEITTLRAALYDATEGISAACTESKLDALSARVKELDAERFKLITDLAEMKARALRAEQERDTLKVDCSAYASRNTNLLNDLVLAGMARDAAEQDRDEAYRHLRSIVPIAARCEASPEIDAARDLVRRLASGPEKIAAASDGEERK